MSGRKTGVPLSPGFVYGYCQEPGGGILVRNALICLQDRGCATLNEVGEFDTNTNGYSSKVIATAKKYKLTAAYQITNFDELGSALMAGYMVEFGTLLGHAFKPNQSGIVPDAELHLDGTDGGHAIVRLRPGPARQPLVRSGLEFLGRTMGTGRPVLHAGVLLHVQDSGLQVGQPGRLRGQGGASGRSFGRASRSDGGVTCWRNN